MNLSKSKNITTKVIILIVLSQFLCTTVWFATNAVMGDLAMRFSLKVDDIALLTSSIQLGFIFGTLIYALLSIPDRFSPSLVFFVSSIFSCVFNLSIIYEGHTLISLITARFFTGFFLAGIYPVGMKIAADHMIQGLGKALGWLVGALVLGTAFPHLMRSFPTLFPWHSVIISTSIFSFLGGLIMWLFVPDGPHRKQLASLDLKAFRTIFQIDKFRAPAFGYFGHMWELYSFWAFVPLIIAHHNLTSTDPIQSVSILSFIVIGLGSLGCIMSGFLSTRFGAENIAYSSLLLSAICCLIYPIIFWMSSTIVLIIYLCFWGIVVVADSPMFSTLVAQNAPLETKGSALTIVNCIGFAITILSIQAIHFLMDWIPFSIIFVLLGIGPMIGLMHYCHKTYNQ